MNNRRLLIFIVPAALIAIVVLVSLLNFLFKKDLILSDPFATNITFSQPVDDKTLYYFSGSSFVSYDLEARKSNALTPQYELPKDIKEIKWSKDAALVQAAGYSPSDMLYTVLVQQQLNPNNRYWWLFDFNTDTFKLVGDPATKADVRNAVWQNNDTFVYTEKQTQNNLSVIKNEGSGSSKIAELSDTAVLEGATADNLLYLSASNDDLNLVAIGSKQVTPIGGKVITVLAVGADNSCLFITQGATSTGSDLPRGGLQLYTAKTNKAENIKPDFSGNAVWRLDQDLWLATGYTSSNQPQIIANPGGQVTSFNLQDKRADDKKHYLRASAITASGYALTDATDNLFYANSKNINDILAPSNTDQLKEGVTGTGFTIAYDSTAKHFAVYINQAPYQTTKQSVLDYLNKYGYDPNQIPLHWYADGVKTDFELPANAVPIEAPTTTNATPAFGGD